MLSACHVPLITVLMPEWPGSAVSAVSECLAQDDHKGCAPSYTTTNLGAHKDLLQLKLPCQLLCRTGRDGQTSKVGAPGLLKPARMAQSMRHERKAHNARLALSKQHMRQQLLVAGDVGARQLPTVVRQQCNAARQPSRKVSCASCSQLNAKSQR